MSFSFPISEELWSTYLKSEPSYLPFFELDFQWLYSCFNLSLEIKVIALRNNQFCTIKVRDQLLSFVEENLVRTKETFVSDIYNIYDCEYSTTLRLMIWWSNHFCINLELSTFPFLHFLRIEFLEKIAIFQTERNGKNFSKVKSSRLLRKSDVYQDFFSKYVILGLFFSNEDSKNSPKSLSE